MMMHPKIKNIWLSSFLALWFKICSLFNNFFTSPVPSQNNPTVSILGSNSPYLSQTHYLNTYDLSDTAEDRAVNKTVP